jgi:hypothetical protein
MARRAVGTFLVLIATLASSADGQPASPQTARATRKLTPIDEARHDASLRTLRNALLTAAGAKDAAQLLPLFASHVVIDFHDPLTPGEVVNEINGYSPSDQALFWQDLREAVELGFIRRDIDVCAPYVVFQLRERALSDAEPIGIVAARVNVRGEPSVTAPVIDRLSYDVLEAGPEWPRPAQPGQFGGQYQWYQIRTPKGELGWVASKYLRVVRLRSLPERDGERSVRPGGGSWSADHASS